MVTTNNDICPRCGAKMELKMQTGMKFAGFVSGKHKVGGDACIIKQATDRIAVLKKALDLAVEVANGKREYSNMSSEYITAQFLIDAVESENN